MFMVKNIYSSVISILAYKYGYLANAVSMPSDANGYANFTNLTVS